jgi:uncharacterized protein YbaR (Trm112 family)
VFSPEFIKITRCLHTGTGLQLAEPRLLQRLNRAIAAGQLKSVLGQSVTPALDAALINETGDLAYPVRREVPVLLRDEAIDIGQLAPQEETPS